MGDNPKLKQFYDAVKANPSVQGMPANYDDFAIKMSDPDVANKFYSAISQNKSIQGLPADYNSFADGLGLKKKDGGSGLGGSTSNLGALSDDEKDNIIKGQSGGDPLEKYKIPNAQPPQEISPELKYQLTHHINGQPLPPVSQPTPPTPNISSGVSGDYGTDSPYNIGNEDAAMQPLKLPQDLQQQTESQINSSAGTSGKPYVLPEKQADESDFDPVTSAYLGIVAGAEKIGKGLYQVGESIDTGTPSEALQGGLNTIGGAAEGGFSALALVNPEVMGFTIGMKEKDDLAKEYGGDALNQINDFTNHPVTTLFGQYAKNNETLKTVLDLGDQAGQIVEFALLHKGIEWLKNPDTDLRHRLRETAPLVKALDAQQQPLVDIIEHPQATPEQVQDAQQKLDALHQTIDQVKSDPKYFQALQKQALEKIEAKQPLSPIEQVAMKPIVEDITPIEIEDAKEEITNPDIEAHKKKIDKLESKKQELQSDINNPDIPDEVKPVLQAQLELHQKDIDQTKRDLSDAVDSHIENLKAKDDLTNNISALEESKKPLEDALGKTDNKETKKVLQKSIDDIDSQIDGHKKAIEELNLPDENNKEEILPADNQQEGSVGNDNNSAGNDNTPELNVEPLNTQENAIKQVENQEGVQSEHQNGNASGETTETGNSNSILGTGAKEEPQKEESLNTNKNEKSKQATEANSTSGLEKPKNDIGELPKASNAEGEKPNGEEGVLKEAAKGAEQAPESGKTPQQKRVEARAILEANKNKRDLEGQQGIGVQKSGFSIDPEDLKAWKDIVASYIEEGITEAGKIIKKLRDEFGDLVSDFTDKEIKEHFIGEKPKEQEVAPEGSSAIKNRITNEEEKAGDINVTNPHYRTMAEHRAEGKKIYEDGDVPDMIKNLIKGDKQHLNTAEVEALRLYKEKQIDNKVEQTTEKLVKAQKSMNVEDIEKAFGESDKNRKKREDFYTSLKIVKSIAGQGLLMFKGLRDSEYSMADTLNRATIANKGLELTPEQMKFYKEAVDNYNKRVKDLEDYQEAKKKTEGEREAQKQIDREKGLAKRTVARKGTIERIKQEREVSKDIISKLLAKQRSEAHASIIPSLPAGVYAEIAKIAKGFVHEGVVKLSDIVDKTLHELKDVAPDISKEHVIDALSGNYNKELKTKTELQKNVAEIQKQAKLAVKLANLENGIVNKKSLKEKGEDSQAVKDLKAQIKSEQERLFPKDSKEDIADKRYKTYLKNKADALNKQIAEGKFEKPEPRKPRPYDEKELKLKAEIGKAKNIIDQRIYEEEVKNEKLMKKIYPAMHNLRIFNMIMSPLTFGKVLGHSVSEFAAHPLDEAGEWGMRKIFPSLSKLSEKGSPTVNSIREYYKAIVSSETYKDMWTQLSKYENTLELAHGEKSGVIDEGYRYKPRNTFEKVTKSAGNLHAAEKVVLEHAAYRESYSKRVGQFLKQNDGNPLTGEQEAFAEGGAMLDALEAIMRSKNKVSDIANNLARQSKFAKAALEVLTPIRRVPLNIARQVVLRNPLTAVYGAGELAYRKLQTIRGKEVTPKQMDDAFKHFSKGLTGTGLFTLGMMFPNIFGGFYDPDRKDEDLSAGGVKGLPRWLSRVISANPLMLTVQMGATLRRNLESGFYGKDRSLKSIVSNTAEGIIEEIPYLSQIEGINKAFGSTKEGAKFVERFVNSYYTPGAIPQFTGLADTNPDFGKDQEGHLVKRVVGKKDEDIKNDEGEVKSWGERFDDTKSDFAKDWSDSWKSHYFGLRQTLPKRGE